ncbi:30S ribosomal protein S17 [Patescibacteria group bacterium]|nr:30S ribosomal protein S17 [Patescibacteria group bacterium]
MSAKVFKGTVVSAKMQKTVVIAVEMPKRHKLYDKVVKKTRRFKARDELGVSVGDFVVIQETRPYSKKVSWKVIKKIDSGEGK